MKLDIVEKKASALKKEVDDLPKEQPDKESYQNRIGEITSALEQFKLDANQIDTLRAEIENAEKLSEGLSEEIEASKGPKTDTKDPSQTEEGEKPSVNQAEKNGRLKSSKTDLSDLSLLELKARKADVAASMQTLRDKQTKLQESISLYQAAKEKLDKRLLDIPERLEFLNQAAASQAEPTSITERITSLNTSVQQMLLSQERTLVTLKLQRRDTYKQLDIEPKELELATLQLADQESFAKDIDDRIATVREREAGVLETQAEKIERDNAKEYPELAFSESVNVKIAKSISELETEAKTVIEDNRQLSLRYLDIGGKFDKTAKTIRAIRQSNTIGAMLRKRKAELPTAQSREQRAADARDRVEEIQAEKFQDSEDLTELSILSIREEVEESKPDLTDEQLDELFKPGRKLEPGEKLKPGEKLVEPGGKPSRTRKVIQSSRAIN